MSTWPHTTTVLTTIPDCNFCTDAGVTRAAEFDAKTIYGPWAYMCHEHMVLYGPEHLGLGLGQRLISR